MASHERPTRHYSRFATLSWVMRPVSALPRSSDARPGGVPARVGGARHAPCLPLHAPLWDDVIKATSHPQEARLIVSLCRSPRPRLRRVTGRVGVLGALAVVFSSLFASPASAYAVSGQRWYLGADLKYCVDSSISVALPQWITYISQDVGQYNLLGGSPTTFNPPKWGLGASGGCSGQPLTIKRSLLARTACGVTNMVWNTGNNIYGSGSIMLNSSKTFGGRNGYTGDCTFDWTVLHEWGHSQGLLHSCAAGAVMYYADNRVQNLTGDDKVGFRYIYDPPFNQPAPTAPCH